ncbi:MAG TPA: hypothetical protein VH081_06985 [Solirubrobacteraceae bacterium]|jgi:uncharacterized membrane protein YgcG|nr:hypothetical protein [Solirubrobacteraceae bacterium]
MSTVRHAMTTLRYRWLDVRIGGPAATMRGQWRVLVVAIALIFACFFAIGRLTSSGAADAVSATATEAPSSRPAIPSGLSGGPPTAGAVPAAIVPKPRPTPRASTTAAQAPTPVVVSSLPVQVSTQATPVVAPTTRASSPAPAEATKQAAPTSSGGSSGGAGRSGGSAPSSAPSGNGSFDSSE